MKGLGWLVAWAVVSGITALWLWDQTGRHQEDALLVAAGSGAVWAFLLPALVLTARSG